MTDIRDLAITFEAKIRSWSKRANGEIAIGVIVQSDDAYKVGPIEPGRRFGTSWVQIGDDEQPTPTGRVAESRDQAASSEPARPVSKLPKHIAMTCNEIEFARYLAENPANIIFAGTTAADMVRNFCGVKSRSDIIPGTKAAERWAMLESSYRVWRARR